MLRLSLGQQLISMVTPEFGMALIQVPRYKDELLGDPLLTLWLAQNYAGSRSLPSSDLRPNFSRNQHNHRLTSACELAFYDDNCL